MYHNNKTKVNILWFRACNKLLTKTYLCMCLWLRLHASQRTIWKLNHKISSGGRLLKFWSIGKQTDFETFSSSHCPLKIVKVLIHRETETFYYKFNYNFFKNLHDTTWLHETRQETKGLTSKNLSVNN